jgi:hypothetical protein
MPDLDANTHAKQSENLRHKGSDDEKYYDKNVALGHRALKQGNAPVICKSLTNEDGTRSQLRMKSITKP